MLFLIHPLLLKPAVLRVLKALQFPQALAIMQTKDYEPCDCVLLHKVYYLFKVSKKVPQGEYNCSLDRIRLLEHVKGIFLVFALLHQWPHLSLYCQGSCGVKYVGNLIHHQWPVLLQRNSQAKAVSHFTVPTVANTYSFS